MNTFHLRLCALLGLLVSGLSHAGCSWPNPDPYCLATRLADRGQYDKALPIWEELSKHGDCDADWQLGLATFMGYGVPMDSKKALIYWNSAAARDQPRADIALADVYFRNPNTWIVCSAECGGLLPDPVVAYRWYLVAERNARIKWDKDYLARAMPHVRDVLTADQRAAAEKDAAQWQPALPDCKPRNAP